VQPPSTTGPKQRETNTYHCHALLLASRERDEPVLDLIPAPLGGDRTRGVNHRQQVCKVVISDAKRTHVGLRVRVDDLVAECAQDKIGLLRHEENVLLARLDQSTVVKRPQFTNDAEKRPERGISEHSSFRA
jgi:hypothetical protein